MAEKYCYRNKDRICDETCAAFLKHAIIYITDVHDQPVTGHCLALLRF